VRAGGGCSAGCGSRLFRLLQAGLRQYVSFDQMSMDESMDAMGSNGTALKAVISEYQYCHEEITTLFSNLGQLL